MSGADASAAMGHNASMWVQKPLEHLNILMINVTYGVRTKIALFHGVVTFRGRLDRLYFNSLLDDLS